LFESGTQCSSLLLFLCVRFFFFVWAWMKSEVYKRKELLARTLDAAARTKKREDQLRRTARDLRTRVAKCIEVGGGIL
jgi:hypothetical protein